MLRRCNGLSVDLPRQHGTLSTTPAMHGNWVYSESCLLAQVQVLSGLQHERIICLLGACLAPPHICIVEELANAGSLFNHLHGAKAGFCYCSGACRMHRLARLSKSSRKPARLDPSQLVSAGLTSTCWAAMLCLWQHVLALCRSCLSCRSHGSMAALALAV